LYNLFTAAGTTWSFAPQINIPIFTAGQNQGNLDLAKAQKNIQVAQYEKTIQTAFREVSDSLIAYKKLRDFREHQEKLTEYSRDASQLSDVRYKGGVTSYLEVLTSETNYFSSELGLARAQLSERLSLVQLYNALGGGWQ
jgi:outer membrane protein, multidrug efflux system